MRMLYACALFALVGVLPNLASAEERPASAPASASSTQPVLDAAARELVDLMKDAEARSGFRRMVCDKEGKVRSLLLSSSIANDENVRAAAHLPDLNFIRINCSWSGISADALGELRRLNHLDKLELRYANRQITLEYGMALAKVSSLRTLAISSSEVDLDAMSFLCALPKLTTLELKYCHEVNDANVVALTQLRQLESLDLTNSSVTAASLDVLAALPHLKQLTVTGTRITEEDVLHSKLVARVAVRGAKPKPVKKPDVS